VKRPKVPGKAIYVATALAMVAFGFGYAMAASLTISSGASENGGGVYHATDSIAWWSETSVGLGTVASGLTQLSGTAGSPTVLAATNQSYAVNAPTAGDVSHVFHLQEAASGVPANTEIEMVFSISTGSVPTVTTLTVYLETQAAPPGAVHTFTLVYDLGSAASGSIVLNDVQQISEQCSAVGTCP
jgi:hypothetical protein